MKVLFLIFSAIILDQCKGGLILHNIRDNLHSKLYGHGLHGENPITQNTPIINIHNYQNVDHQTSTGGRHLPPSVGWHKRGDYDSLSNYYGPNMYGINDGGQYMNSNIKAGGLKYGGPVGAMGGYGNHHSMKQESNHHREGPKFGQHHDSDIFGNTKIGASAISTTSSATSSHGTGSSSSASSSSAAVSSASLASASSSSSSSSNTRVKPWRY